MTTPVIAHVSVCGTDWREMCYTEVPLHGYIDFGTTTAYGSDGCSIIFNCRDGVRNIRPRSSDPACEAEARAYLVERFPQYTLAWMRGASDAEADDE